MPRPVAVTVRSAPTPPCVLIAEDDLPTAELVSSMVRDAGYTPLVTYQGRQALDLARTHRPTLLIIDLILPRLDGKAVIAAPRADADCSPDGGKPGACAYCGRGCRAAETLPAGGGGRAAAPVPGCPAGPGNGRMPKWRERRRLGHPELGSHLALSLSSWVASLPRRKAE